MMSLRVFLIGAVLGLLALFSAMNWPAFAAPSSLTLGFAQVDAPLGLILLLVMVVVSGLFVVYIVYQQAAMIVETRRHARTLKEQRDLAEKAEASRFTELKTFLEGETRRIEAQVSAANRELAARFEQLEQGLQASFAQADRVTSAQLGEIEDKLDRVLIVPNKGAGV
jgi:uncharacterized integral membrane protein